MAWTWLACKWDFGSLEYARTERRLEFGPEDRTLLEKLEALAVRAWRCFDLRGHAAIHTAPNVRRVSVSPANPVGYEPLCVGTTTSARMERFTRPLMEKLGVRLLVGKGGLGPASLAAFRDLGGAYLAVIGGTAVLETTWIEAIEDVDLDDLNPESLWKCRVRGFGPLLVAMDRHRGSLYATVDRDARARREAALARLGFDALCFG